MKLQVFAWWRLLRRPAALFWIAVVSLISSRASHDLIQSLAAGRSPDDAARLQILRSLFLFCVTAGLVVGQAMQEAQHCALSFTLPGLRRSFRIGAALLALASVGLTLAACFWLQGTPSPSMALINLLGFGVGVILIDPRGSGWLTLLQATAVLYATIQLEALVGSAAEYPAAALPIGAAILCWCGWRALADATFRSKPLVPSLALISLFSLPAEKRYYFERLRFSKLSKRRWSIESIGDSTWRRVQSAVYGAAGFRRLGWAGWVASYALFLLLLLLGTSMLEGFERGGGLQGGLECAYRSLAYTAQTDPVPGGKGIDYWALTWYSGAVWLTLSCGYPVYLRTKKVLPISRQELGRVTYWTSLLHLGVLASSTALVLGLALPLLAWQTGFPLPRGGLPNLARAILFNVALLPLVQWWRLSLRGASKWKSSHLAVFMLVTILYCAALTLGVRYWTLFLSGLGAAVELSLLALLIVLAQWFFRGRVMNYYLTADLA